MQTRSLVCAAAIAGVFAASPHVTSAAASGDIANTAPSAPVSLPGNGAQAFTGLANIPQANAFTGTATTSVHLKLPPGRREMTPRLLLQ